METENKFDYKSEHVFNYTKDYKTINHASKRSCKVLKFSSNFNLKYNLAQICRLKPKDFPCLLIFVIETSNFDDLNVAEMEKQHCFDHFNVKRPIILQIKSENEMKAKWFYRKANVNQFVNLDEELDDFKDLSAILRSYTRGKIEEFRRQLEVFFEKFPDIKDSSTILRFLKTLNISGDILIKLILKCALQGSKSDLLALLDASFEDDGRMLNDDAQHILSETFEQDATEMSLLFQAVQNPNKEVSDYLISNCTLLIQQLPFKYRISVSKCALDLGKIDILCDLLEFSDFPFPSNLDESSITHQRLLQIMNERKEFHKAITDKNESHFNKFINKTWSLKLVFNIDNKSALACAAESKNFDAFVKLKSLGFKAEEFDSTNDITCLSKKERKKLDKNIWSQTQKNAADAKLDGEKSVHLLRTRSYIHNRMITKDIETKYRVKIRSMFEDIYKIPLCSIFLDAASQCEDLKIIFDFESESVESVDLKSGPYASGSTYAINKWIFIGVKETSDNSIKKIEGVLIHEIVHYVMRLIYENNEKPYYKNDKIAEDEFDKICKSVNKWTAVKQSNDEDSESSDEDDDEPVDDECEGIISSVYLDYEEVDYHPELIVRPLQILAHFRGDEIKIQSIELKYKELFKYIKKFVEPEINKLSLQIRESIRRINKTIGDWSKIKSENLQLKSTKNIEELMKNKFCCIITNIPKLALKSVFQYVQNDSLPDTSNIFISSETCENKDSFDDIQSILCKDNDLKLIADCSKAFNTNIKKLLDLNLKLVTLVANKDQHAELKELLTGRNLEITEINYKFEDFTVESQFGVIQKRINFQGNKEISLEELLTNKTTTKDSPIDIKQYSNIIDDNLLKLLTENSQVSINVNPQDEVYDKHFEILFQPRNLIKTTKNSETVNMILQDELLDNVKNMKNILISDFGGTGKSWMMKQIARNIRMQTPRHWVTYVDLKLHTKAFEDQKTIPEFSKFMTGKVLNLNNNFEEKIFNLLYKGGRVVTIFDGFDEIPEECAEFVLNLFKSFESYNGNQLWIATRNYCEKDLQQKLKFDAVFKLEEFTEENGMDLIAQTWLLNDPCDIKTDINIKTNLKLDPNYPKYKKIVKKLESKFPKKTGRPIGFPLFYRMIANVYSSKRDSIDILTMFLIFDEFVKQQCKRWMSEKGEPGTEAAINSQNKSCGYFEIHQLLALRSLFPRMRKFCNLDYDGHNWMDKEINACGLATKNDEVSFFQHECFREFFVVKFILRILTESSKQINEDFWEILKDILSNYKFVVLRMFLNDALAQGTETYKKVKETLSSSGNYTKNVKSEEVLMRVFKEGHVNLLKMFIELSPSEDYKIVKDVLHRTIKEIIEVAQSNETIVNIFDIIMDFLRKDDLKDLILDQEVFQNIIDLRSDITVMEKIAEMLQNKIDKNCVRDSLTWISYAKRNSFYFLFKSKFFNVNNFKILISLLQKYLNQNEIVKMIKECDETKKNILHICVEMMNEDKLKIMWIEIQNVCNELKPPLSFKELVIQNESSVLHVATTIDNEDFHDVLWKLLLQIYPTTNELEKLVLQKDTNGFSFLHLLVKNKSHNVLKCSLKNIEKIPFKDILKIKDNLGRNLLLLSICISKNDLGIHQVLWTKFKTSITSYNEIMEALTDTDNEHNNIFQLLTHYSSCKVFTYIIQEIETMISYKDMGKILKILNEQNKNLIQIAVMNNFDLEFHEQLWKIVNKYMENREILEIINSTNESGNNILFSAVLHSKSNIVELTWNQIRMFICGKNEQNKYLSVKGQEKKSFLEVSQKNKKNPEVATWVDKLMKEFLPKEAVNEHPHGKSENLLRFEADNQITINNEKLQEILEHPEVRNRKIVAFSVSGAFRKGKSFFLNYCLRFLYANYPSINHPKNPISKPNDWIGENNDPLTGFSWRSGSTRDTMGISIWNDVFLHTDDNDEKLAIIVLDTQGLFDNSTSPQDNSRIFAIGTLISSIQVLNILMHIQEDQLQYLQFATDYAKFAANNCQEVDGKCFQNLIFLIRDWPYPNEYEYGVEDGEKYLENILKTKDDQNEELKSVRNYIHNSFEKLSCILLPPPGNNVAIGRRKGMEYDGNHGEMDNEFKIELIKLIEYLLSPKNLVPKKINRKNLTSIEYFEYVKHYLINFQSRELPKPKTIYESTVKQQLSIVIDSCLEEYKKEVEANQCIINKIEHIPILNEMITSKVMLKYYESNKMGNKKHHHEFKNILLMNIDNEFKNWSEKINEKITANILENKKKIEITDAEINQLKSDKDEAQRELLSKNQALDELETQIAEKKRQETEEINRQMVSRVQQAKFKAETAEDEKDLIQLKKAIELAEIRAQQAEIRVHQADADKQKSESKEKTTNNRNACLENKIKTMRTIIIDGELTKHKGLWGFSEEQRVKIRELCEVINNID